MSKMPGLSQVPDSALTPNGRISPAFVRRLDEQAKVSKMTEAERAAYQLERLRAGEPYVSSLPDKLPHERSRAEQRGFEYDPDTADWLAKRQAELDAERARQEADRQAKEATLAPVREWWSSLSEVERFNASMDAFEAHEWARKYHPQVAGESDGGDS